MSVDVSKGMSTSNMIKNHPYFGFAKFSEEELLAAANALEGVEPGMSGEEVIKIEDEFFGGPISNEGGKRRAIQRTIFKEVAFSISNEGFPRYVVRYGDDAPREVSKKEWDTLTSRMGQAADFAGLDGGHRAGATGKLVYGQIVETREELNDALAWLGRSRFRAMNIK